MVWEKVGYNPRLFLEKTGIEIPDYTFAEPMKTNWINKRVAYLCMEYGIHESFPNYSGGLGILAGDHIKAASDLGLPLTGFGLLYQHGYFSQIISGKNEQHVQSVEFRPESLPMEKLSEGNKTKIFSIPFFDHELYFQVWILNVGSVKIYLMDTNVPNNNEKDRKVTDQLYGGDSWHRLEQEILLGFGAVAVAEKEKMDFDVFHLNEGHTSFATIALWDQAIRSGNQKEVAKQKIKEKIVFTTHTMVPAGHDVFGKDQIEISLKRFFEKSQLSLNDVLQQGMYDLGYGLGFNMTVLGLNFARVANGVSKLNVEALHNMWGPFLKDHGLSLTPITNGIHPHTFMSPHIYSLLDKYCEFSSATSMVDQRPWDATKIPDQELWSAHLQDKYSLIKFVRNRIRVHLGSKVDLSNLIVNGPLLEPKILTIGFARRFATYKRANLIFSDPDRLKKLLTNSERPVQVIFSGKPHPKDEEGKKFLKVILDFASDPEFEGRVAFIPDYDMAVARKLVAGVDVWLNTPRVPREASGTSGMKAAINGVLNASTLDGWWPEAYNGKNGWVIGKYDPNLSPEEQDKVDVESFYRILQDEIIPNYYERNEHGIPHQWVKKMKESIRSVGPKFSSHRMVLDYSKLYFPSD
ncbi:MAG: alpha-glucan family phosphorylase [Methanobacteriota archaeon]|nr:MAG: alpha-glucan family phosphorylase [Euryarchaeota archaeon]